MPAASHSDAARKTMARLAYAVVWCLALVAPTFRCLGVAPTPIRRTRQIRRYRW